MITRIHSLLDRDRTDALQSRHERGFTYLFLMFTITAIGIALTTVGQQWSVIMQRDREAELLFRGNRIKDAIERYAADYEVMKATRPTRYPRSLTELTKRPKRYLQKVYKDPITSESFELITTGAEVRGVRSPSTKQPFNQVEMKGAETYHEVAFQATAAAPAQTPQPSSQINPFLPGSGLQPPPQAPPSMPQPQSSKHPEVGP